jgi:hypothetical protein
MLRISSCLTRLVQPLGVLCFHVVYLLLLSRLLHFVARLNSTKLTILRRFSRAVIALVVIGDLVPKPLKCPHASSKSRRCYFLRATSLPHRLHIRSASAATLLAEVICSRRYPNLHPQLRPLSQVHAAIPVKPYMAASRLHNCAAGDSAAANKIAGDVDSLRNTAYTAAGLQPVCEAAVGMFMVAAFIAAGGLQIYLCMWLHLCVLCNSFAISAFCFQQLQVIRRMLYWMSNRKDKKGKQVASTLVPAVVARNVRFLHEQ